MDLTTARADLERLAKCRARELSLDEQSNDLRRLFADRWQGERSDVEELESALNWVEGLRSAASLVARDCGASTGELLERWVCFLPLENGIPRELAEAMQSFEADADTASSTCMAAASILSPTDLAPWHRLEVDRCLELAERWQNAWERDRVRSWCRWQATRALAIDARLHSLVEALEVGTIGAGSIVDTFERSYGESWYKHTISADPALRDFQTESHERAILKFRELDTQLLRATHEAVRSRIAQNQRSKVLMLSGHQGGFLRREIQKQKRHRPIRTLFKEAGDLIRELRPCVLMSPLSVAQFLDPSLPRFDVVVFDEASQMPTWDAIGAIARGNQLIVVGDPKQLPPTNFFGKSTDGEQFEGDDDSVEDLESVLDECLASNLERHTLSWHYRSRHESLIAFSNRHYYDGKLITFPAAQNEGVGVTLHPVEDGVYDFGKSRTNRREAEELVREVIRRLRDPKLSKLTVGVVTLSQAQQSLVEDLLDHARRENPELEAFFDSNVREPVFVKNLENVQGDERDVILFTVCYGPDLTGKVRMNFGPLNKDGGWRRLNVAITRARQEFMVFSTLRADQIDLNRTRSAGVRDLQRFLEFADRGNAAFAAELETNLTAEHDSPFEAEVCEALEQRGWIVHRQVGCSAYRVDLAVIDPESPGRYVLGVECDGASYHSAPSARDRDKLRQELLESLGWTLHRIWSTDWWENREREIEDMLASIEVARGRLSVQESTTLGRTNELEFEAPIQEDSASQFPAIERLGTVAVVVPETNTTISAQPLPTSPAERVELVLATLEADAGAYQGRLERYRATPEAVVGDRSAFYDECRNKEIAKSLRRVVEIEGPVLADLACCRVGELWGYSHLKGKGLDRVIGCVSNARVHVTIHDDERVLWAHSDLPTRRAVARVPLADASRRSTDQIPLVELGSLMRFWVEEAGPMPERDLFDHTLHSIGLKKLGKLIRKRFETALSLAVADSWLVSRDGVVRAGDRH